MTTKSLPSSDILGVEEFWASPSQWHCESGASPSLALLLHSPLSSFRGTCELSRQRSRYQAGRSPGEGSEEPPPAFIQAPSTSFRSCIQGTGVMPSLGSVLVLSPCEPSVVADSPTSLAGMVRGYHLFRPIEWHLLPSSPGPSLGCVPSGRCRKVH